MTSKMQPNQYHETQECVQHGNPSQQLEIFQRAGFNVITFSTQRLQNASFLEFLQYNFGDSKDELFGIKSWQHWWNKIKIEIWRTWKAFSFLVQNVQISRKTCGIFSSKILVALLSILSYSFCKCGKNKKTK